MTRQFDTPKPVLDPIISILADHELVMLDVYGEDIEAACLCRRWNHSRADGDLGLVMTKHRAHVAGQLEERDQAIRAQARADAIEEFEVMVG